MTKNIFDETVDTLIKDAKILTKKYHDFLNGGKAREAIDIVKLNAEIEEIVAREQVLRSEIAKIIAELEG